ncbi:MAG: hypothetical protein HFJ32_05195, partial [Clostridia bacterium]|nr:hypothetical protein [Clostridia bacterium]
SISALKASVKTAEDAEYNQNDYSVESWEAYTNALQAAKDIIAKADATAEEIETAKTNLETAMEGLTTTKTGLESAIAEVEKANYDPNSYTEASYTELTTAIQNAKAVVADENATQEQINNAKTTLENAVNELVDISELRTAIQNAENAGYVESDYSTDSWSFYQTTLGVAKSVLNNKEATQTQVNGAKEALAEAINGLTTDKTELEAAIDTVNNAGYKAEDYTEATYTALTSALQAAEDIVANEDAKQSEINDAKIALENAVNELINISALKASVKTAEEAGYVESDYSEASWKTYTDALQAAKDVIAKGNATVEEIETAKTNLETAINGFTTDKTELEAIINAVEAKNYQANNYTLNSYVTLINAISDAKSVVADKDAKQSEINSAKEALENAERELVDITALKAIIQEVESANYDKDNYSTTSWKALEDALKNAQGITLKKDATKTEVEEAVQALRDAMNGLTTDKTALETAITNVEAENYNQADYTANSYTVLTDALQAAKDMVANEDATQKQINEAKTVLDNAISELVSIAGLNNAIETAENAGYNENDYSPESWKAYTDALQAAKDMAAKVDATKEEVANAKTNLEEAIGELGTNTTVLENAITAVENAGYNADNYTVGSYGALTNALQAAKDIVANENATQQQINNAKIALDEAVNGLVDISALRTDIQTAENAGYNQEDYSVDSWKTYTDALQAAKDIVAKENATKAEVAEAKTALQTAINGLTTDRAELEAVITTVETADYKQADYTANSYATLTNALQAAKDVVENENATQSQINEAKIALEEAISGLVNISGLNKVIQDAENANYNAEDYTVESWNAYTTTLGVAKTVVANEGATQKQIDGAKLALEEAIAGLTTDKTALEETIAALEAENYQAADYTANSYAALTNALQNAKAVVDNKDAKQSEINEAKAALDSAVSELVNISGLNAIIQEVEDANYNESDYSIDSWTIFKTAFETAQDVVLKVNASKEEVTNATQALRDAINGLTTDITELEEVIAEVEAADYKQADYTANTYDALANALQTAKTVVADENATQQQINNAKTALEDAVTELIDVSELKATIETAKAKVESDYSVDTWAIFETAKVNAEVIAAKADATVEEIAEAKATLEDAMSKLDIDNSKLTAIIETTNDLVENDYTVESWKALTDALKGTEGLTKQSEIDNKVREIQSAIDALDAVEVDQRELDKYLDTLLPSTDYSNWEEFDKLVQEARAIKDLQSKFDAKLEEVKAFELSIGIVKIDTSNIEFTTEFVYNGQEQKVQVKEGTTLPKGLTIESFGEGRTNVGETTVTVTFGVTDATRYEVDPATRTLNLVIKPATVEISKDDFVTEFTYNGQPQKVELKDANKLPEGMVITSNTTTRMNVGTSTGITVKFGYAEDFTGAKNYIVPNAITGLSITIKPAVVEISKDDFITEFNYNGQPQNVRLKEDVTLPEELMITDFGKTRTNVGTSTGVTVKFGYKDPSLKYKNYVVPSAMNLSITIKPAPVEISADDFVTEFTYNGQPQNVKLKEGVTLPEQLIITDFGKTRTNIGKTSPITVKFGYKNPNEQYKNYAVPDPIKDLSITITPATFEISKDDFVTEFTYDGQVHNVQLKDTVELPAGLIITSYGEGRKDVGTTPVTVTFGYAEDYTGYKNYNVPEEITDLSVTINKADQKDVAISLNPSTIIVGKTATISGNGIGKVTYASNNEAVATVDEAGVVTGISAGTAEITATYTGDANHNEATAKATITVEGKSITNITAEYTGKDVIEGLKVNKADITVTVHYNNDTTETVENFEVEDKAIEVGENTITITALGQTASINVTGIEKSLENITVEYTGKDVIEGLKVNKADIKVTAHYNNNTTSNVEDFEVEDKAIEVGENTLTITALGTTTTIKVNGVEK